MSIQSLDRAFMIIELFKHTDQGLTVKEIQELSCLPKGTIYRFLSELEKYGYIQQDKRTKVYSLGLKLLELGMIVLEQIDIRKKAFPFLEKLRLYTNENVNLAILDRNEVMYLERLESAKILRLSVRIGSRVPIYCSSTGKVILAFQSESKIMDILNEVQFVPFTSRTISDKGQLTEELKIIREKGYAISDRELFEDVVTVAVPIFDHMGNVEIACNISTPYFRFDKNHFESNFLPVLIETGKEISKAIGYRQ